jgi:F-type H+-transporting ATPase subunit c
MRPGFRPEIVVVEEERRPAPALRGVRNKEDREMVRKIGNVLGIVSLVIVASPLLAMAQEAAVPVVRMTQSPLSVGLIALAANLGVGIAAFGSALGQGRMAASAMESIGRNPNAAGQIFTPMLLGLAFIEALTLYALVIGFLLQLKI